MTMIADHAFDLIVNIPKNHTKRELTNGYKIRRGAIDHNIPLITNARLASAFIEAFCEMNLEGIQIKSWNRFPLERPKFPEISGNWFNPKAFNPVKPVSLERPISGISRKLVNPRPLTG